MVKKIEYDPRDYEVIDTIQFDKDLFQKVQFKSGYYGIVYRLPDEQVSDVILVGTDKKSEVYVNLFLELASNQTEVINQIHEKIDKVTLLVQLDKERTEIFEEVISKDMANDLIERLKISNELYDLRHENDFDSFPLLSIILFILIILNFLSILYNLGFNIT